MGLKITNAQAARPTVWLYGDIGEFFGGISADDFRKALNEIPTAKEIELHIHSEGGIFFDGVAMHSALRQRKGPVHVIVDGIAASAASIVAMGGTTVAMATHAWLMIHEARSGGEGTAEELRAEADRLDQINSEIVRIYGNRWKEDEKALVKALHAETWYPAEEAVAIGLADSIIDKPAIAARFDPAKYHYRHTPEPLVAKADEPQVFTLLEARKGIVTELFPVSEDAECSSK
jgi:ATP-dependent Clp protease protease subunit